MKDEKVTLPVTLQPGETKNIEGVGEVTNRGTTPVIMSRSNQKSRPAEARERDGINHDATAALAGIDRTQFTVVFEGDISKLPFNPMKAETIFGKVIASGYGNAFDEIESLIDQLPTE